MKYDRHKKLKVAQNTFAIVFWAAIVILCLIYKDQITVDNIVAYAPDNMFVAAVVMLMLFAVKSVLVFVYCGLLYAASGILFPVPIAILVNILGSLIMAAIPFWIGKRAGVKLVDGLLQNHPKLKFLKDAPNKSPFFMSFFVRIIGILPSDMIGLYFGATGVRYKSYITGAILGMLPQTVTFCLMGMSINDVTSPEFLISFICELSLMIVSITAYVIWMKRMKNKEQAKKSLDNEQTDG